MKKLFYLLFLVSSIASANELINGHGTGLIYDKSPEKKFGRTYATFADCDGLPDEFDLRDLNVVPPIRNQGSCGSCWAFSKTASLESAYAAANGEILDLSEQELVSCDKAQYGCGGGFLSDFDYQIKNGQGLESDFKYTASDARCQKIAPKVKPTKFLYAGSSSGRPSEKDVMCALFHSKTIPWTVVAAGGSWGSPPTSDDGIMQGCGSKGINHAVGLIGWKKIDGKVYFKVRNSWGTKWGSTAGRPGTEKGYALSPHLCNLLNDEVAYIVTEKSCKPPLINAPKQVTVDSNTDTPVTLPEAEQGTEYIWYDGKRRIGKGYAIFVNQDRPTVYKVVAKNSCGQSESLIKVEIKK